MQRKFSFPPPLFEFETYQRCQTETKQQYTWKDGKLNIIKYIFLYLHWKKCMNIVCHKWVYQQSIRRDDNEKTEKEREGEKAKKQKTTQKTNTIKTNKQALTWLIEYQHLIIHIHVTYKITEIFLEKCLGVRHIFCLDYVEKKPFKNPLFFLSITRDTYGVYE